MTAAMAPASRVRPCTSHTLMVQGTTSDAGKSTLVAALCRWLARRGMRVAPFKPQNMALNSAVTVDGGEIGRAQAMQARACGIEPHTDFNPVLLKPNSDTGAQVIIHGHAVASMHARDYHAYKSIAQQAVMQSYDRLVTRFNAIVVEGAGSPAEINLRDRDIANMGFAEAVNCPVILIADIDRGGVFAHLVGTLALLSVSERARVVGFVINKFRGDLSLLQPGLDWLESETNIPVLGVLPYLHGLHVEAEDAIPYDRAPLSVTSPQLKIIVPVTPRISNHTDFDALRLQPEIDFHFIAPDQPIPPCDLIILPGSKSVRADLVWLRERGWEHAIQRHVRYGGKLIGICGGLQMLGRFIADPHGLEGAPGTSTGLGLLDIHTTLEQNKQLRRVSGTLTLEQSTVVGYEIHAGVSTGSALAVPAMMLMDDRPDGAISADNQILATYVHGLFDDTAARNALLRWAGAQHIATMDYPAILELNLDRLADCVDAHLNTAYFESCFDLTPAKP